MTRGIRDKVAIVGMGCTKFGEFWDKSATDLMVDAAYDAYESAGIEAKQIDACWLGTLGSGSSGLFLSEPLKLDYVPVTRVENFCASGSEAFRNACYAVASGASDMAMALGVEKRLQRADRIGWHHRRHRAEYFGPQFVRSSRPGVFP